MDKSKLLGDIRYIKLTIIGILIVAIFGVGYSTVYANSARKDCYVKAREAMGIPEGQAITLSNPSGSRIAENYSSYYGMCMSKEYGLDD